ncbi:MAG TPA: phosphatase [Chloroflexi bacterium]|nr:phosphatase [Chloroflexota bacterium]
MTESIYNFLVLDERIATGGQPSAPEIAKIAEAGYEVIINLALSTSDNALENEKGLVESQGMIYIHIPVLWENPTLENLESFLQIMSQYRNQRIFVHCVANMRVSVFMALYRILGLGWPPDQAFQTMHEIWEPNPIWAGFIEHAINQ